MSPSLVRYERARVALRAAKSVDEVRAIRDSAIAFKAYAHQAKDRELETLAAEIRLRAERRAGELLARMKVNGTRARRGGQGKTNVASRDIRATLPQLGVTRDQAATWQKLAAIPEQSFEEILAERKAQDKPIYADHVVAPNGRRAALDVHFSSETPEHYTPSDLLALILEVFGGAIDLDPCSNSHEQPHVPATTHYTIADNGLEQPWRGRVFVNPPYGRDLLLWMVKIRGEWETTGRIVELIALLPARTDTEWFEVLTAQTSDLVCCFWWGRLIFVGNTDPAPFPSLVAYFGPKHDVFARVFGQVGSLWVRPPREWFIDHDD